MELDRYDTQNAKYVVIKDDSGGRRACARLLPTTVSYMLPDLFPQLLGGSEPPRDPCLWELSRLALSVRETCEGRILELSRPALDFLNAVLDFARQHNIVRLIFVTSVRIERLLLRAGIPVHRMSPPAFIDGQLRVALFIEVMKEEPSA